MATLAGQLNRELARGGGRFGRGSGVAPSYADEVAVGALVEGVSSRPAAAEASAAGA